MQLLQFHFSLVEHHPEAVGLVQLVQLDFSVEEPLDDFVLRLRRIGK